MNAEIGTDRLVQDIKNVVNDAEDLMKTAAGQAGEKAREARDRLAVTLESARETCARLEEKAIAGAKAADRNVREHPYQSIGLAFGVGILIGVLIGRK
jgi:ElaB/YqjD/DUF883 family membrane-anchored ribosome-binding protein